MPLLTTTIEDTSPLILYSGNDWRTGSSSGDIYAERYSQSSYMVTNVTNARASFAFYGNGLQLFGAKRPSHGSYQISIDSNDYPKVSGAATDAVGTFQTSLFSTAALKLDYHTVTITNVDVLNRDLDFITWQTPVGLDTEQIIATTIQDSDSSFVYTLGSDWATNPPNLGMFLGGSAHTTKSGAYVEFTFTGYSCFIVQLLCITSQLTAGGAMALYGPVGPDCAPYSVSLDGNTPTNYSATKQFYRPQQMLYQASNLGGKKHKLLIRSEAGNNSALYFAIDYAMVYTTLSLQRSGGRSISVGSIVGIALGSFLGLLIILALLFYYIRKQSKRGKSNVFAVELFSPRQQYTAVQSDAASTTTIRTGQQPLFTPLGSDFGTNTQVITMPHRSDDPHQTSPFSLMPPPHVRGFGDSVQGTNRTGSGQMSSTQIQNSEARQPMPRILEEKRRLAEARTRSTEPVSAQYVQQSQNAAPLIQLTTPDVMDMPPEYHH